jgi:type I restriction enzyme M protein
MYRVALHELLGLEKHEVDQKPRIAFDDNKIRYVVEVLQGISFLSNKADVLGDFFEKFVRDELKQTKGQYLTHHNIVDFIIYGLGLDDLAIRLVNREHRLPTVIDPSCGSGTFLIRTMVAIDEAYRTRRGEFEKTRSVEEFAERAFQRLRKNAWAQEFLYGIEINPDLAMAAKINMVGHGDGSAHIEAQDGLVAFAHYHDKLAIARSADGYAYPVNGEFDVVMSNPPFSVQVDRDTARELPELYSQGAQVVASLAGKKSEEKTVETEVLFIERWYQLLKPKGRLGVVLPESVFDTTANRDIRMFLYRYFQVKAVVSLPHLAFAPYTLTKTSILFAQKKTEAEVRAWDIDTREYESRYDGLR